MVDGQQQARPDLDSPERIRQFVDSFYAALLADQRLAPIFIDVAQVDLEKHKPLICSYWEKLLLNDDSYQRHTMNIHRALNAKRGLRPEDFRQWVDYFVAAVDGQFAGPRAQRAKQVARAIASNMNQSFGNPPLYPVD